MVEVQLSGFELFGSVPCSFLAARFFFSNALLFGRSLYFLYFVANLGIIAADVRSVLVSAAKRDSKFGVVKDSELTAHEIFSIVSDWIWEQDDTRKLPSSSSDDFQAPPWFFRGPWSWFGSCSQFQDRA